MSSYKVYCLIKAKAHIRLSTKVAKQAQLSSK